MDQNEEEWQEGEGEDPEEFLEVDVDEMIELLGEANGAPVANAMEDLEMEGEEEGAVGNVDVVDHAAVVFKQHTGAVFCCDIDPEGNLVVSGGEDDKAYVWSANTGETLFECTGHTDSVTAVGFSHDAQYVASADMGGNIKVWKVTTKTLAWEYAVGDDLEWLEWHHSALVLMAGFASGDTWMWKIPGGDFKIYPCHSRTESNTGRILPDGKRALVGYGDGVYKVWDLKAGKAVQSFTGHTGGHQGTVTCMDCHRDSNLIVTGSTDVTAKVSSSTNGKVLCTFKCAVNPPSEESSTRDQPADEGEEQEDSVEAVGFSKVQNLVATGTLNGVLSVWDIASQTCRHQCQHSAGITRLKWDTNRPLIYTSTLDGVVSLWNGLSGEKQQQWTGHEREILDLCIARNGTFLVTASEDHTCRIFKPDSSDLPR